MLEDGSVIFPITSIESFSYEGPVHNMEVDEDNSYQVHGVATHNCSVEFTTCTKCGNVAEDETHLCPHIRYFKGSEFVDQMGNKRKIAELCGHVNAEPGSVKFIEASWVANPAFTGAVLRSILNAGEVEGIGKKLQVAFSQNPRTMTDMALLKAARSLNSTPNSGAFLVEGFESLADQLGIILATPTETTWGNDFNFEMLGAQGQGPKDSSAGLWRERR